MLAHVQVLQLGPNGEGLPTLRGLPFRGCSPTCEGLHASEIGGVELVDPADGPSWWTQLAQTCGTRSQCYMSKHQTFSQHT